jgi:hypothetical protein
LRFAASSLHLDCAALADSPRSERERAATALCRHAAALVHDHGLVVFRIGRLRLGSTESRALALLIAERLGEVLEDLGAPPSIRLEVDRPQETFVPEGFPTRTLLPHHDGGHCSYLTPSREDVVDWNPAWRTFSTSGYTTTEAHKLYQGIFVADPGEALSATTYYDWIRILEDVRADRGMDVDVPATAAWLGANVRRALELQDLHGSAYPSLGALLGVNELAFQAVSFHHAEAALPAAAKERFPILVPLARRCPCGSCVGETERVFCHVVLLATGLTWAAFRARYELLVPNERYDLVFGHNLTMLHGGLAGGRGRVIEPLCLVVDEPSGAAYERWLGASWRGSLPIDAAEAAPPAATARGGR